MHYIMYSVYQLQKAVCIVRTPKAVGQGTMKKINLTVKSAGRKCLLHPLIKVKSAYGPMWPTRPELIPVSVA